MARCCKLLCAANVPLTERFLQGTYPTPYSLPVPQYPGSKQAAAGGGDHSLFLSGPRTRNRSINLTTPYVHGTRCDDDDLGDGRAD